jgi:protein-tyrosine phosphatase
VIEIHTHLLHGIDDGPASETEALELARALHSDGARIVVATPHVSKAHPDTPTLLDERLAATRQNLAAAGIDLDVRPGAEIELTELDGLDDGALRALALSGGPWLLLECPHIAYPFGIQERISELRGRGFQVVLAHPERSSHLRDDLRMLAQLVEAGAVCQVTAASLAGSLGRRNHRASWEMLDAGLVHAVASDAHDTVGRPPGMSLARDLIAGARDPDLADALTCAVPQAIVDGADPDDVRAIVEATGGGAVALPGRRRGFLWRRSRR